MDPPANATMATKETAHHHRQTPRTRDGDDEIRYPCVFCLWPIEKKLCERAEVDDDDDDDDDDDELDVEEDN
ncbi:hypothetical protein EC968_001401 [Mortierella alpina]|nr:hypothetical protein EC968_001401 [Mortierella alpina]